MKTAYYKLLLMSFIGMVSGHGASAQPANVAAEIRLPEGFSISVYTDEVPNARSLALGTNGTVFVSTRRDGRIYAVVERSDGRVQVHTLIEGLRTPNGLAYYDGDLYIAETRRLLRLKDVENHLEDPQALEVLDDTFPTERHHGWRYIEFGPDGKLYMSVGAPCNVCDRDGFGIIQRMNPDGSDKETIAYGVRNSVGLEFHPESHDLWFTDNGRDMLGDNTPPGELNRLDADGSHFGFPFCHGSSVVDPEFGAERPCADFAVPTQELGPHVAPLGLEIYDGAMFPAEYRGHAFIAEHGSWNRSEKIGYRITLVRLSGTNGAGYEVFADGWLDGDDVSGRPVDLLVMPDGSMLVSDDQSGVLYRIRYEAPRLQGLRRD